MGEKDTGTRTLYMMDSNGQKYELGGLQEQDNRILIHVIKGRAGKSSSYITDAVWTTKRDRFITWRY